MPTANPPGRTLWLMAAIVLVGLNLRPSMAAVGPLLNAMRGEIALSFGAVSLLTALPVLTLGLGMFFGLGIARRVGEWRSVALALLLIGAASALRLGSRGLPDLLGSAMLAGLGIALIQALMPTLIKARFGARTPLCMGLYVTAIMAGAALSASAAPTLAEHAGWRLGLGAWAALAALALLAWWLQPGTRLRLPDAQPGRSLLRYPRTWLLVLFFGLGTACYTCVLAWLAPYYLEQGWSAQESGLLLGFLTAMEVLAGSPPGAGRANGADAGRLPRPRLGAGQPAAALGAVSGTGHRRAVPHGLDRLPRPLRRAATRRSTGCPGTRRRLPDRRGLAMDRRAAARQPRQLHRSLARAGHGGGAATGAGPALRPAALCGTVRRAAGARRRRRKLALRKGTGSDGAPDAVRTPRC